MPEQYALFETAVGTCGVAWRGSALTAVQLPEASRKVSEARLRERAERPSGGHPPAAIERAIADLQRYFAGTNVDFSAVIVDLTDVTPFHRTVYEAARAIGWGETVSYGELARRIAMPDGARAVGYALSRNSIPVIIPCHRVLAAGRRIGGFSAYGGVFAKEHLLFLEGGRAGGDEPLLPGLLPTPRWPSRI
jgi:methylated-DNA-[protein]-cysteine S-methyltransferase